MIWKLSWKGRRILILLERSGFIYWKFTVLMMETSAIDEAIEEQLA